MKNIVTGLFALALTTTAMAAPTINTGIGYENNSAIDDDGVRFDVSIDTPGKARIGLTTTADITGENLHYRQTDTISHYMIPVGPGQYVPISNEALATYNGPRVPVYETEQIEVDRDSSKRIMSYGAYVGRPISITQKFTFIPAVGIERYKDYDDTVGYVQAGVEYLPDNKVGFTAFVKYVDPFDSDSEVDADWAHGVGITTKW